jgi:signal transduction histidine kinase
MITKTKFRLLAFTLFAGLILSVGAICMLSGFGHLPPVKLLYTLALAQSSDPSPPESLTLTDEMVEYPLGLHLEILEDPSGELTIDEVSSSEFDSQFVPSQVDVPNFGFSNSAYWARIHLNNQTSRTDEWLLEVDFANMQYVDLYSPLPDSEEFTVKQTGALRPVSTRDVLYPKIVFRMTVPTQSQPTYYLRFQNGASMTLGLTLWTQDTFLARSQIDLLLYGLFFGALLALLAYHLFLLITVRDSSYLYFVILLASLLFTLLIYEGFDIYLLPDQYLFELMYFPLSFSLLNVSIILFSDAFLELRTRLTKLHKGFIVFLAVWGGLMLLSPFISYHQNTKLMVPMALITLIVVLAAGIASWRQGFNPARFFMVAWFGMLASLLLLFLVRMGILPSTTFSETFFQLGIIWMAVCFSLALSDRINLLKTDVENANRGLRQSEQRLSQILEGLPLGVILYGKDHKPRYANRRVIELFSIPSQGVKPDPSVGRTLAQAIQYFSLKMAGSHQEYPLEKIPVYHALQGEPASADDIEIDQGDKIVPLEFWAAPVRDEAGNVEAAVVAILDITQRKQAEAELAENRKHLEMLVESRTAELSTANEQLNLRLDWLSAINQVNQIMARSADFAQIYEKIIEIVNQLFSTQDAFIAELDESNKQLKFLVHSCRSDAHPVLTGSVSSIPEAFLDDPFLEQGNLTVFSRDQLSSWGDAFGMHVRITPRVNHIALVPLRLRESVIGFLGLEIHDQDRTINQEEAILVNIFALDIAQIIEDNHLFQQVKELISAEERNRLARDLHDSVTQTLFTASVLAEATPRIWDKDQEMARQNMEKLSLLIRGALAEMRTMLIELRSGYLYNQTLDQLIRTLVEAARARSHAVIRASIMEIPLLPKEVTLAFYRIAQEALNNVLIHAAATEVKISLLVEPERLEFRIQDDGSGFDPQAVPAGHLGIKIMVERAAEIGGDLQIRSEPGTGTELALVWMRKIGESAENA